MLATHQCGQLGEKLAKEKRSEQILWGSERFIVLPAL